MRTTINVTHEFEFELEADIYPGCPAKMPSKNDDIGHPAEPADVDDVRLVLDAKQLKRIRQIVVMWERKNPTDEHLGRCVQAVLEALDDNFPGDLDDKFEEATVEAARNHEDGED